MKYFILVVACFYGAVSFSQDNETVAQINYTKAEEFYNQQTFQGYEQCIEALAKAEKALGNTNSKILYLKLKALSGSAQGYYFYNYDIDTTLSAFFKITDAKKYPLDKYAEIVNIRDTMELIKEENPEKYKTYNTPSYKETDAALVMKWGHILLQEVKRNQPEDWTKDEFLMSAGSFIGKAAEKGNVDAILLMGELSANLFVLDPEAGISWYKKAAEKGSTKAMVILGSIYENAEDYKSAVEWYTKAAEKGEKNAMTALASIYQEGGPGVKKNKRLAEEWKSKSR